MGDEHEKYRLKIRKEECERSFIGRMHQFCAIQALLTLALLEQKVIATVPAECQFTAAGATNSLLGAAMGLELGHNKPRKCNEFDRKSNGNTGMPASPVLPPTFSAVK